MAGCASPLALGCRVTIRWMHLAGLKQTISDFHWYHCLLVDSFKNLKAVPRCLEQALLCMLKWYPHTYKQIEMTAKHIAPELLGWVHSRNISKTAFIIEIVHEYYDTSLKKSLSDRDRQSPVVTPRSQLKKFFSNCEWKNLQLFFHWFHQTEEEKKEETEGTHKR